MTKAECDNLIARVAADVLGPVGYQRQKALRWTRIAGHFFVAVGLPWSRGYYRMVTGLGCDLIPYAAGWKTPRSQKPGRLAHNFLLLDSEVWKQAAGSFSHDPLLHPRLSLETVARLFADARAAIESTLAWPVNKASFMREFERKRRTQSALHFDANVDHMITEYVLSRAQGVDTARASARLAQIYKTDSWRPGLDAAASKFADLPADQGLA